MNSLVKVPLLLFVQFVYSRFPVMSMPLQTAKIERLDIRHELPEIKKPMKVVPADESLSEWELARQTSKTWSMEQE